MVRFYRAHCPGQPGIRSGPRRAYDRVLDAIDRICAADRNSFRTEIAGAMAVPALGAFGRFRRVYGRADVFEKLSIAGEFARARKPAHARPETFWIRNDERLADY